jgi:hypothetical protein
MRLVLAACLFAGTAAAQEAVQPEATLDLQESRRAEGAAFMVAAAKARAVTRYADLIADAYSAGLLDDEEMARELHEIAVMTHRFTTALRGYPPAVTAKAADAATSVIFGAIRGALGFAGSPLPEGLVDGCGTTA